MRKITIDKLSNEIIRSESVLSGNDKGILVFVKTEQEKDLHTFATKIASAISKNGPWPIYLVQGDVRGEFAWPFSKIVKYPRLKLLPAGQLVTETGGLIFPQDQPIVLLVECFDCLEPIDQRAYSHLVDGEGRECALHKGSILIAGLLFTNPGRLEPGAFSRGTYYELA